MGVERYPPQHMKRGFQNGRLERALGQALRHSQALSVREHLFQPANQSHSVGAVELVQIVLPPTYGWQIGNAVKPQKWPVRRAALKRD